MANVKITDLTNYTDPETTDVMPIVDVVNDTTKKVSVGEVVGKITGDVDVATDGTSSITAGAIVDADVNANAEIAVSKLADGTARQLLQTDAAGTGVEWTDNVDVPGTLDVTGATTLDSTLGVNGQSTLASAAVSDLTEDRVVIAGASGELEDSANLTFDGSELGVTGTLDVSSNATVGGDLTVEGNLTVEGTTTTIETTTLLVEDKNIEMGVVDTPSDTTADGGGITLKGATDKTINWVNATDAWTSSEHIELASGKEFYIDGNGVLNATTLGSGVVNSSLTSVGTIATGTWQGTAIDATYLDPTVVTTSDTGTVTSTMILDGTIVNGDINASAAIADTKLDTISTAGKVSNSATTATDANTANAIVARDASGDFTAGTITADLTGNADTATALETARDIGGVSFDGTANINLPGVNTTGNQDTSGNAATATKLDSSRTFEVTGDVTGTVSSDLTSGASIATSIASGVIVDGDVNAAAAIAGTKIDPDFGSQTVETTGVFSAAGGAEATPSITFTGDLNTGIYSPGADQVAISTNGTERVEFGTGEVVFNDGGENYDFRIEGDTNSSLFFVDASAEAVGIGTTAPEEKLDVDGAITWRGALASGKTSAGALDRSGNDLRIRAYGATSGTGELVFRTGGGGGSVDSEAARIDANQRLLVGTSSASSGDQLLEVSRDTGSASPTAAEIRISSTTSASDWSTTIPWGKLSFYPADGSTNGAQDIGGIRAIATSALGGGNVAIEIYDRTKAVIRTNYVNSSVNEVKFPNITTTASAGNAYLDSADGNNLLRSTSSLRYKTDIEDLEAERADAILNFRPVWYRSTSDADNKDWSWYGLIAEEVAEIEPRLVHWTYLDNAYEEIDGEQQLKPDAEMVPDGVQYDRLTVLLLDVVQRQQKAIETLEAKVAALEAS